MFESAKHCHELGATELVAHLQAGRLSLRDLVSEMLAHTEAVEGRVKAFAHHGREFVDLQTERLEPLKHAGLALPRLYGVPVAIKDNIDTADYPTEWGFAGARGRTPSADAYLVHKLRRAGA